MRLYRLQCMTEEEGMTFYFQSPPATPEDPELLMLKTVWNEPRQKFERTSPKVPHDEVYAVSAGLRHLSWHKADDVPPEVLNHSAVTDVASPNYMDWSVCEISPDVFSTFFEDAVKTARKKEHSTLPAPVRYAILGFFAFCIVYYIFFR